MYEQFLQAILYINLGLAFFALLEFVALIALCRKTAYMRIFGGVCAGMLLAGAVLAIVQLAASSAGVVGAGYASIIAFAFVACAFAATLAYLCVLSVRSDRKLCLAAGILQIAPPVGAITALVLAKKLKPDSRAQRLIFTGYAYTYAACEEYCDVNKFDYMDAAGDELPEPRDKTEAKAYIKQLSKNTLTPQGMFEYGVALAQYAPKKAGKAYKYFVKAAKSNYAPALFNLGYCYETGSLVKKDFKTARAYYKRAAAAGDKDAPMRLAILEIKSTDKKIDKSSAVAYFAANSENDICARFNYALAQERGDGTQKNTESAIDLYYECMKSGMDVAKLRLFEIMCACINTSDNDAAFKKLALIEFDGAFGLVMQGMVAVKEKRATDAADIFLRAVRARGEWEGIARLLTGTLYLDCGKTENDRANGAAYVKTAAPFTAIAKNIESTLAASMKKRGKNKKPNAESGITTKTPAAAEKSDDGVNNIDDVLANLGN